MLVQSIKQHGLFIFILLACAMLRFFPLFSYQFTLDELSGLYRTEFDSFGALIEKGVKIDAHPALIQVFIYYLSKCFGYHTWVIKLPFLLMSLGAVIYAYAFSLRNFSRQAGIFSALIVSFSLVFVFYAPIARMYIPGVFFSIALLYYFFEIIFFRQTKSANYVLFGLFVLLSALNQHLNALFACTVCLGGLFFLDKAGVKAYLITCGLIVLAYLPHLPVTLYQLGIGGIGIGKNGWLPPPDKSALPVFIKILLGTGNSYLLFVLLIGLAIGVNKGLHIGKKQWFLLLLFLLNYGIIHAYSVYRAPVFQNSALLFSGMALVAFITSLMHYRNSSVFYGAATLLALSLLFKSYVKKEYLHQAVKTVFEYQFERTAYYKALYGNAAVYPVFFDSDRFMKKIYFKKYGRFACKSSEDSLIHSTERFTRFVSALTCDYLVLASSMPSHQAIAREYFPYLIENTQTQGINYKVYSKKKGSQVMIPGQTADRVLKFSDAAEHGSFTYEKIRNQVIPLDAFQFKPDSLNEFPFDAKAFYDDVISAEGQVVLVKARYKTKGKKITTCISVNDQSTNENYNYASKETGEFVPAADSSVTVYVDSFIGTTHRQAKGNSNLAVYVWNREREAFTLTAFEISLVDYWHWKWHFWE